ncbi:MAG: glycosyltransferase family 2 protein, partial [Pseudomonadota bacterium]
MPERLSAVIITRDAATLLPECLQSVRFADEILIVDSGSQDATREIAKRHGARFLHQDWLGYGKQKQFAVERAANDWVLCLDADERVSPELA